MQDFKKLRVWHEADDLTVEIYRATRSFPKTEQFGLTQQCRESAASIQANIAEGCGRNTARDTAHFFQMALASGNELANWVHVSRRLEFLDANTAVILAERVDKVRRMVIRLLQRLRR